MNNSNQMPHAKVILRTVTMLVLLVGCNNNNVPAEIMPTTTSPSASSTLSSMSPETPSHTPSPTQNGETKTFIYDGLKLEVTNVYEARTESMTDDAGNPWEYSVFVCYPGATVNVLAADMSDSTLAADGNPHPNWGVFLASGGRKDIVNDMNPFEVTPDVTGIYNLEASLYVLKLEKYYSK